MISSSVNEIFSRLDRIEKLQCEVLSNLPVVKKADNHVQDDSPMNESKKRSDSSRTRGGAFRSRGYKTSGRYRLPKRSYFRQRISFQKNLTESSDNSTRPCTEQSHSSYASINSVEISDEKPAWRNLPETEDPPRGMSRKIRSETSCEDARHLLKESSAQTSRTLLLSCKKTKKKVKRKKCVREIRATEIRPAETKEFLPRLLEHFNYCFMDAETLKTSYPQSKPVCLAEKPFPSSEEETQRVLASATRVSIQRNHRFTCVPFFHKFSRIFNDLFFH